MSMAVRIVGWPDRWRCHRRHDAFRDHRVCVLGDAMNNPKLFQLPTTEKWDGPMATPLPWYTRLWRRLTRRKPTWNSVIFDNARRGR